MGASWPVGSGAWHPPAMRWTVVDSPLVLGQAGRVATARTVRSSMFQFELMYRTGLGYPGGVAPGPTPLEFLQLVADPQRWRLLAELGRSDRRVGELAGLVGEAPNLVSYHLAALRSAGLVTA